LEGFKKLAAFIYAGHFTIDSAILCAAKAAYLAALLTRQENAIERYEPGKDLSSWQIANPDYNKLNKVKKTSPEAFYYYFSALELLGLAGG
jgi:hypothetical protein